MMSRFVAGLLLGMAALWLSSCAGPGENYVNTSMVEELELEILPNTSKMFVYHLRWPKGEVPSNIYVARTGNSSRPEPQGIDINRHTPERLFENAALAVARTGFCRDGFFEIDRNLSRYHLWLKGECKEGASAEDKAKFGVKQLLPSSAWRSKS